MSLAEDAILFAKHNKKEISHRLTSLEEYPPSDSPVTIFMAGSPGAGKTEYSKNLLEESVKKSGRKHPPLRIDSDELRSEIPGYVGNNSSEVQGAVSILLSEMYTEALKNRQSVIIDGTLSNYEKAEENIKRSLKRDRGVFIFYVYQNPEVAWRFTLAREKTEGRNIPKNAFITKFFRAKETVQRIHENFKDAVTIVFVRKNFDTNAVETIDTLHPDQGLDAYIQETYTQEELEKIL